MKIKLKPNLIPICINFFFLNVGYNFAFPYCSLLMRVLGLTLDDVVLVSGLVPFIAFILTPLLGYIGDKLGYKMVLVFSLLLTTANVASFNFLPPYRQHFTKVALNTKIDNLNSSVEFDVNNIVWFGRYSEEGFSCNDTADTISISKIECNDEEYQVDFDLNHTKVLDTASDICDEIDSFTCKYVFKENVSAENVIFCSVIDENADHTFEQGSHSLTLWTYFGLFVLYKILVNGNSNISEAVAATLAKRERSSYAIIIWFGHIGALIPHFTAGQLVDHVRFGSTYVDCLTGLEMVLKDFKTPFFISGAITLLLAIYIFFYLKVDIQAPATPGKKAAWWRELSWLLNPAAAAFFFQMTMFGVYRGGEDTFFFIYATEDLGTSTAFLGYMEISKTAISLLIMPFAKPIMEKVGVENTFCLGFFGATLRGLLFGFPFNSPPYEFIGYGLFDGLTSMYFIANVMYIGKIVPQHFTATAISIGTTLIYIVGKGIGAILAGFIVNKFDIKYMFILMGSSGCVFILLYWIAYHLLLKKFEPSEQEENSKEDFNEKPKDKDNSTIASEINSTPL